MTRSASLLALTMLVLGLGACGRMGPLQHPQGTKPLPVAVGAKRPATADELMTPGMQTRPQRGVDILTRSDRRPEDPFDKPPGADNGRNGHED